MPDLTPGASALPVFRRAGRDHRLGESIAAARFGKDNTLDFKISKARYRHVKRTAGIFSKVAERKRLTYFFVATDNRRNHFCAFALSRLRLAWRLVKIRLAEE